MINLNSSSLIKSSIRAFETCVVIVSSLEIAKVLILRCFAAFILVLVETKLPISEMAPVTAPLTERAKPTGAPTPVANNAAPVACTPIVIDIKPLSIILIILETREYFL